MRCLQRLFALFRFYRDKYKRLASQAHKIKKRAELARFPLATPSRNRYFCWRLFLVVTQFEMQAFSLEGAVQQKTEIRGGIFFAFCRLTNCFGTVFYFDNSYKSSFKFFSTSASLGDILFSTRSLIFCFKNADCFQ